MAFKNFLSMDTYTRVDNVTWCKDPKQMRWILSVYNADKTVLLASKQFDILSLQKVHYIKNFNALTLPEVPVIDEGYLISSDCVEPDLQMFKGFVALWEEGKGWGYWSVAHGQVVYGVDANRYFTYNEPTKTFVWSANFNDYKLWDKYFSSQKVIDESNILAQAYIFLKTLPGFENVIDC